MKIRNVNLLTVIILAVAFGSGAMFLFGANQVQAATNLIVNPSLEASSVSGKPDFWSNTKSGSNTAVFSYPVAGFNGGKAASISVTRFISGEAEWYFDEVVIKPGAKYVFSEKYKANVQTLAKVRFTKANGSYVWLILASRLPAGADWQSKQYTFVAPLNATKLTVFHALARNGTLAIDDYVLYQVDTQKPTVQIIQPFPGTKIDKPITIIAQALDNIGVAGVQFFVDGNKLGNEVMTSPWSIGFDPTLTSEGLHLLRAVARDDYGNRATSTAIQITVVSPPVQGDITAPTVQIKDPQDGMTVSHSIAIQAEAADPTVLGQTTSGVDYVQFFVDGTPYQAKDSQSPYETILNTELFADGSHSVGAQAVDKAGNVSSLSQISVNFSNTSAVGPNLILNPGLEENDGTNPTYWLQGNWGTNTAVFSPSVAGEQGNGANVLMTNFVNGDAKWYFKDVDVTPGVQYTFSDSYMSDVPTRITVQYTLLGGGFSYNDLAYPPVASSWQKVTANLVVPDNVVSLTIFHLIERNGSLTIDNASLTSSIVQTFGQGMVSLDFDDGWLSTYQNALPILSAAGMKSTQYIISGSLTDPEYANAVQVLDMQSKGQEIGSHSKTHPYLTTLDPSQIQDEIAGSKSTLESLGVNSIRSFDYPYGDWNNPVAQVVQQSGYLGARTVDTGFNYRDGNPFQLKVQAVNSDTSLTQVQLWIDQAAAQNTWLILVFHKIQNSGDDASDVYWTSPANLQQIVDYLATSSAKVVTTGEGLYQMTHK